MRIDILAVGRLKQGAQRDLFDSYLKRMSWQVTCQELDDDEKKILAALPKDSRPKDSRIVMLDERGKDLSSQEFSRKIGDWQLEGRSRLCFVIGGAGGLTDALRARADLLLAFGRQTWPHQIVRVMLAEQIYRAQQILSGHPYHRE